MAISILDELMAAERRLRDSHVSESAEGSVALRILHNAVALLLRGYSIDADVEPLLDENGNLVDGE